MLTGRPPFSEFEPLPALFQIVTSQVRLKLPPQCSEEARDLLVRTLNKTPRERPAAADLLAQHPFCRPLPPSSTSASVHSSAEPNVDEALA